MAACEFCDTDETTCAGCYRLLRDEASELRKEVTRLRAELATRPAGRPTPWPDAGVKASLGR